MKMSLRHKKMITGLVFISPWIIGFICIFSYSLVKTVEYSLNKLIFTDTGGYELKFQGLQNFVYAFMEDPEFTRVLSESVVNMVIDVPLIIFFSLFIAIILNRDFRGRSMIRALFFLPVIMSSPAITDALAANLNNMMGGLSSSVSEVVNVEGLNVTALAMSLADFGMPLGLIEYIIGAVGRVYEIVSASGIQIIIFLAALQSISPALYEVADIEGATKYESFWKITFPMVSPLILTNVIYTIIDMYSRSEVVEMTQTIAFTEMNFGLSAAISIINTIVVGIILIVFGGMISKRVFYHY